MAATTNNGIVLPVELQIKNLQAVANSLKEFAGKNILEDSLGGKKVNNELQKILTSLSQISAKAKTALTTNSDFSSIQKDVDKVSLGMAKIQDIVNGLSFKDLKIPEEISNQIGILQGRIQQLNNGLSTFKASQKDKLISNDSFLLDLKRALPKDATKILEKNYDELYKSVKNGMSKVNSELAFQEGLFRKNQEMITQNSSGKANFSQWGALDFLQKAFAQLPKDKSKYSDQQKLLSEYMEVGAGEDGKTQQFTTFKNGAAGQSQFFEKVLATYSLSDTQIQEIRTRMQDAMKKLNKTQAEIMRDMASDKELGAQIMANKSYEDLTRSKIHYEGQKKDYSSSEVAVDDLRARAEAFKSILAPLEAAQKEVDAQSKTLAESLKAPTKALEEIQKEILSTAQTSPQLGAAFKAGNDAIVSLTKSIDEGKQKLQQLDTVIGKMNGISNFVNRYVGLYAIVRKVTTAIKNAFNNIKELDKTITNIAVVTNMSQKDLWGKIGEYTQIAQQFGVATQNVYTVSQLFYQQGLQTSQVMALTSETLKMAKISGMEYSDAANAMTVAIRAFKIEMTEAQQVTDTYSALAAKFAVSSAEIANAMEKTASSAANVGMSLQSTSAFISVMEQTTRESAQNIGSALKSIISRYGEMKASPKDILNVDGEEVAFNKVDTALKSVGISIKDSAGQFRDFDDVIIELARKWDTLDNNTQRYIATVMAGNRQQSRFIALVSNYDELNRAINVANNSENASMVQVAKTMDSLESKTNQLKNAWQQLYLSLKIEDGLKGTYEILTNILKTIGKLGMFKGVLPTLSTLIGFGQGTKGVINTGRKWVEDRKKKIQGNIDSQEEEVKKIKLDMDEAKKQSDQLDEYIQKELIKKVKVIVEGTNQPSNPIGLKIDEQDSVETLKQKIKNAETLVEKQQHLKELDKNSQEYADARKDMNKYAWNIGTSGNINAEKRLGELKAALAKAEGGQLKTEEQAKPEEPKPTVPITAQPAQQAQAQSQPAQEQQPQQLVTQPQLVQPQVQPAQVPVQFQPSTNFSAYMQNQFKDIFSKAGGTDGVINQEEITARMKEAYANAPEEIKAEFDKMGQSLSQEAGEVGEQSVKGFTQEIQAGSATTAAAGEELSNAFITAVKSTLGIASPSKVMAAFGQNAGGTFNDNVKGCIEGAAGAGTELAEAAISAIDTVIEQNKGKIDFNDVFAPLKVAQLSLTEGKKTLLEKVEQETTAKLGGRSFLTESVGADGLTDNQRKAFAEKEAALPGNEAYQAKIQELAQKYGGRNVQDVYKESSQLYSQYRQEGEDITKQIKTLENQLYTSVSNNRDKYLSEASRQKQREYDKAVQDKLNDTEEGKEYRRLEQEEREMLFRQQNELQTLQTSKAFKKSKKDAQAESLTALQKRHAQEKNELKGYKDVSYQRLTRAKSTLEYSDPELLNLQKQLEQQENADIAAEVNKNEDLIKLKAKQKEIFDKRKVADETAVQADKDIRELDKLKAQSEQPRKALEAEKQATIASNKEVLAIQSEHNARVNEINKNYDTAYSDIGIAETTLRENAQKRIDRRLKRSQTRPQYVAQGIERKAAARAAAAEREVEKNQRLIAEANVRVRANSSEINKSESTLLGDDFISGLGKNTTTPRDREEFVGTPATGTPKPVKLATWDELREAGGETPEEKAARLAKEEAEQKAKEAAIKKAENNKIRIDRNLKRSQTRPQYVAQGIERKKQAKIAAESKAAEKAAREQVEKNARVQELRAQYDEEDKERKTKEEGERREAHQDWVENRQNRQEIEATRNSAAEKKSNAKIEKTRSRLSSSISAYEKKYGITREDLRRTEGSKAPEKTSSEESTGTSENEPKADAIITVNADTTPAEKTVKEFKEEIADGSTTIPVDAEPGAPSEDQPENKIGDALENVAEDVKDAAEVNAEESENDQSIVEQVVEGALSGDNPADAAGAAATAAAEELVADQSSAENKKDENGPVGEDDLARESTQQKVLGKLDNLHEDNEESEDADNSIEDFIEQGKNAFQSDEDGSESNEGERNNEDSSQRSQSQVQQQQERQSRRERKQEEREKRKQEKKEYKEKLKNATGEERKQLKKEHRQEKLQQWQSSTAYKSIGVATNVARMVAPLITAAGAAHEDKEGETILGQEAEVSKVLTGIGNGISGAAQGASMGMMFGPAGAAIGAIAGFALTGLSAIWDGLEVTDQERLQMRREEAKKKDDAALQAKAKETELSSSLEQLKQLKKNQYNSAEDMKAYQDAMNNMAQQYPELISAYDSAGNAVINLSDAERKLINVREDAARASAEAAVANSQATALQLGIVTEMRDKINRGLKNKVDSTSSSGFTGLTSEESTTYGMSVIDSNGETHIITGKRVSDSDVIWGADDLLGDEDTVIDYKGLFDSYLSQAIEQGALFTEDQIANNSYLQKVNDAIQRHTTDGHFDSSVLYEEQELQALSKLLAENTLYGQIALSQTDVNNKMEMVRAFSGRSFIDLGSMMTGRTQPSELKPIDTSFLVQNSELSEADFEKLAANEGLLNGIAIDEKYYDTLTELTGYNIGLVGRGLSDITYVGLEEEINDFFDTYKDVFNIQADSATDYFGWGAGGPTTEQLLQAKAMFDKMVTQTERTFKAQREQAGRAYASQYLFSELGAREDADIEKQDRIASKGIYSNLTYSLLESIAQEKGYETSMDWKSANLAQYQTMAMDSSQSIVNSLLDMTNSQLDQLEKVLSDTSAYRSVDDILFKLNIDKTSILGQAIVEQFVQENQKNRERILKTIYQYDEDGNRVGYTLNENLKGLQKIEAGSEKKLALEIAGGIGLDDNIISKYADYFTEQLISINDLADEGYTELASNQLSSLYDLYQAISNIDNDKIQNELQSIISTIDFSDYSSISNAIASIKKYGLENNVDVSDILLGLTEASRNLIFNVNTLAQSITEQIVKSADEIDSIISTNKSGLSLGKALEAFKTLSSKFDDISSFDEIFTFDAVTGKYIYTAEGMRKSLKKQEEGLKEHATQLQQMVKLDEDISSDINHIDQSNIINLKKSSIQERIASMNFDANQQYTKSGARDAMLSKLQNEGYDETTIQEEMKKIDEVLDIAFDGYSETATLGGYLLTSLAQNKTEGYLRNFKYENADEIMSDITSTIGHDLNTQQAERIQSLAVDFINNTDYSDRTWNQFITYLNKQVKAGNEAAEIAMSELDQFQVNKPNQLYAQIDWTKLALGTDFSGVNQMLVDQMAEAMGLGAKDWRSGQWINTGGLGWNDIIDEYLEQTYKDNEQAKEIARSQILGQIEKSKSEQISTAITEILNGEGQLLSETSMALLADAGELKVDNGIIEAGQNYVDSALELYWAHFDALSSVAEQNKVYAEILNKSVEKNNSLISTLSSGASMDIDSFGNFLTMFGANLDEFISIDENGLSNIYEDRDILDVDQFGKIKIKDWSGFIDRFGDQISQEVLDSFEYENAYSSYVDGLIELNTQGTDLVKKQYDNAFSSIVKFNQLNISKFDDNYAAMLADNGAGEIDNGILKITDTIKYAQNAIDLFKTLSTLDDDELYEETGWTSEDLAKNWKAAQTILSNSREAWTSVGNNLSNITTDQISTLIEKGGLKVNDIDSLFISVGDHYVMSLEQYALELEKSLSTNGVLDSKAQATYVKAMNTARQALINNLTSLDWTKALNGTATNADLDTFREGLLDNLTALGFNYSEFIDSTTGNVNVSDLVTALSDVDESLANHIKETIADLQNSILSSISSASEYTYQGTNSISDMQKFVDEYNKIVENSHLDINEAFEYDTNLNQFTLSADVLKTYVEAQKKELEKLGMSGDAIEEYIKDQTITLMRQNMDINSIFDDTNQQAQKKAISSLKNNIQDYMEFYEFDLAGIDLGELPSVQEIIGQRKQELYTAYRNNEIDYDTYIERFQAVGNEVIQEVSTISADTIVELLYNGGENAVKVLKQLKGDELTSDEVSAVYNAGMNRINAAQEALEQGEGTILTGMAAQIARVSDGIKVTELADGSVVIKEITSMADAYSRLYATMRDNSAHTTSSLNSLYAKFLTSIDQPEADAISVLNDAMGMSYEALGEMLAKYGKSLEQYMRNAGQYGIKSLGNGMVQIYDFDAFAESMNWEPDSDAYIEARKAYNDSLIALDKKIGEDLTTEVKAITEAKASDRINLTYLSKIMNETVLQRIADTYFSEYANGIARLKDEANVPALIKEITTELNQNSQLLPEELAELADAVSDYINGIIDLINNGITGSLINVQAQELQSWADSLGISLDFTKTADGLKLSQQQAIQLYNEIKNIDSIQARLVFDKLNESLTETNEHYKSISDIQARIIELEKIAPDARSEEYQQELDLAKQILAIRSTSENEGFNFMSNKIPGAQNNPINYYNNWAQAIQTLNNALNKTHGADKGLINYQDWYNIVTEMNNIAALGQDFEVAGVKLDGSMEAAAALIEKGAAALTADSTGNIKVSLEKIGVDFQTGSGEMSSGINEGIAAMAKSQVKMLDGMIRMLEVIVQMEELGDITGEDNHIDFGDFFVTGDDGFAGLNTANTNITKWVDSLLSLDDKESDLYKALDQIKVNNKSLRDLLTSAKEGKLNIDDAQALTSVLDSMWQMYQSGEWDLDNLYDSLASIAQESGLGEDLVIQLDNTTLIISGGQITQIDWEDSNTKEVLEKWKKETGQKQEDLQKEIQKYHNGQAVQDSVTLETILQIENKLTITQDKITVNVNGQTYTFDNTQNDTERQNIALNTALLDGIVAKFPDKIDFKKTPGRVQIQTAVEGHAEVYVEYDKDGNRIYTDDYGHEGKNLNELALDWWNDEHPDQPLEDFSNDPDAKKQAYWHFGEYVRSEVTVTVGDTKVDLKNPSEIREKVKEDLESGAWRSQVSEGLNPNGELELTLGGAKITISGAEIADANGHIDMSKLETYIREQLLGMDLGLKETISEGIKEAFTEIDDGKIQQLREAITETSTAFNELKTDIAQNTPTVDVDTTTAASKISSLQTKWDNLTTSMRSNTTGGGSASGNVGMAQAKGTLMGELGPELVVSNGRYFVAGQGGPEMVDLADDAIVFNHLQTKSLLKNGTSSGRGKAITNERNAVSYAKGNIHGGPAKASASAALNALKQLRAQWKALESLTTKDLASKGGGGGGGGDPKAFLKDLEKWYNWLQQIAQLEKEITAEETKRSKIQSDMIAHGADYYTSQIKSLDALQKELVVHQSLTDSQQEYFNERREALNNQSAFSALYGFGESGQLYYKSGALQWLSNLVGRNAVTGEANYTAEEQYNRLVAAGFGEFMKYDSSGNEIKQEGDWYATAVQAFWDKIDSDKEEMQSLHDSIEEHKNAVVESQSKMNEIMHDIEDNQITVEQKVLKAVEDFRQKQIDEAQKERNAIEKSSKALIDGLNKQLQNEKEMYSKQQSQDELGKLQRQLAILQRSGGSASQIADLQQQISDKQQNMYFDAQQEQIDALQEASDNQLQRLDAQISLMTESLAYEKENGLLWQAVSEQLAKSPEEIMAFIQENTKDYASKSAIELTKQLREDLFDIERFKKFQEKVEDGMNGLINQYGDEAAKARVKAEKEEAEKAVSGEGNFAASTAGSGSGSGGGSNSGESNIKKKVPEKSTLRYKFTYNGKEYKYSGKDAEKDAKNGIEILAKNEYDKLVKDYPLSGTNYYNWIINKHKKEALASLQQFDQGGMNYETGLAMLHGTSSKPESVLTASQTSILRNDILSNKPTSLLSLLTDFRDAYNNISNATNSVVGASDGGIIIENATVEMNVSQIANDYDAQRAGEQALDKMLQIARKTQAQNRIGR